MNATGKVRVEITRELIQEFVKDARENIPENATLLKLTYNPNRDLYDVVFLSEKLDATLEGAKVPYDHELEDHDR